MLGSSRRVAQVESNIVWIFGSPRSGSTWLWAMLSELDRVVAINEPLIGYYLSPFMSDQPGVSISDLDINTFTIRRIQADRSHQFFANEYRDVWNPLLRRLLTERFAAHAKRAKPRSPRKDTVVVVKEPNGSQSADIIMSAQPRARLLFLLRDGRDVVDSEVAATEEGSWTTKNFPGLVGVPAADRLGYAIQSAYKWLWRTEVVEEAFEAHRGPKLLIRYEDMRADPARHFMTITDWLGIALDEAVVAELADRHAFEKIPDADRGHDKFFRSATPGGWRENLTDAEKEAVCRILGPKLLQLGYEH